MIERPKKREEDKQTDQQADTQRETNMIYLQMKVKTTTQMREAVGNSQRDSYEQERKIERKGKEKGETFQTERDLGEKGLTSIC